MKLLIGKGPYFARFTLPDQRGFILARSLNVPVDAIIGKIQQAAVEPLRPRMFPFEDLVPPFKPVQFFRNPSPEFFWLFNRLAVDALIVFEAFDVRLLAKMLGTFELALLLEHGMNVGCRHGRLVWHSGILGYGFSINLQHSNLRSGRCALTALNG